MVLYKRKPIKFEPIPPFLDDNTEVWEIEATGEVFTDYEKYLARYDYYRQKHFTCEATGHQGYTFWEARNSEMEASKEANSHFPETLRARMLAFLQFQHTPRMDDLVNLVFEQFRDHFVQGDRIIIEQDNQRRAGQIQRMVDTRGNSVSGPSLEEFSMTYSYEILLDGESGPVTKYKASELSRDRRYYSKLILKQFLRSAVSREAWIGAPWKIKEHLAKKYNIDMTAPDHKTRNAIMASKSSPRMAVLPLLARIAPPGHPPHYLPTLNGIRPAAINGAVSNPPVSATGPPALVGFATKPPFPRENGDKQYHGYSENIARAEYGHIPPWIRHPPPEHIPPWEKFPHQRPPPHVEAALLGKPYPDPLGYAPHPGDLGPNGLPGPVGPPIPHGLALPSASRPPVNGLPLPSTPSLPISLPFQNNFMQYQTIGPTAAPTQQAPPTVRLEPIKYPIEDLEIREPREGERPPLKFISDDVPEGVDPPQEKKGVLMKSVGPLLSAWDTLNVHDSVYSLDSFTFDDFVAAMSFSSEDVECELLIETHCAILKQIVDESGRVLISLPNMHDSEAEDEEEDDSGKSTSPEPVIPVRTMRTTRSSLAKSEALALKRTPTPEPPKQLHKAAEFLAEFDWIERCKTRYFRDGGWQAILVGVLYNLTFSPIERQKAAAEEILAQLVPPEEDPSVESIAHQYVYLDVNLRISAMELILAPTIRTEIFKEKLQEAATEMTRLRKLKIEHQKKRKELADEILKLDTERKILLPANMPPSPTLEAKGDHDVSMTGTDDISALDNPAATESEEEPRNNSRKLRHAKSNKRKIDQQAARKEKAKKAKAEAAKTKQQLEWEKLLKDIQKKKDEMQECESQINEIDDDLRETNVYRTKVMGKDRFLNKYYWFEHNAMPFGGVPYSSTASYGYANARIWVQGPDQVEFQANLEEPRLSEDRQKLGFTVPDRKSKEEGKTHLSSSDQWGYYDDPEDLKRLISWLDERGVREKALRKELQAFRDQIVKFMGKMKDHLTEVENAKAEDEEGAVRVSTRKKTYVEKDATQDRCLLWTNSMMRDNEGYSHYEEYEPPKKGRKGTATVTKSRRGGRKS